MSEEHDTGIEKLPGSDRTSARKENAQNSPKRQQSPLSWDFDSYFQFEPNVNQSGRLRASSWDDSDDNLPPIPDITGSKTCRIYTSDDRKPKTSVAAEIDELKKKFFTAREKEDEIEGNLDTVTDELEANYDRRLSPARIRRRSRSSGSSSPVLENPVSPMQTNKSSGSDTDVSPNTFHYDPTFYLNHFFTELKSRRISLIDPISVIESIEKDIPTYDSDVYNELCAFDGKEANFCKTSRVLPRILEVEENRRDLQKRSEENLSSGFFQRRLQDNEIPTGRSRRSDKSTEEGRKIQKGRYKSFSSEYLRPSQKPQNGSLSERSPRFFEGKLDHDFISLSAKTGRMELASLSERENITPVQLFCVNTPNGDEKSIFEDEINDTSRKSIDRSEQSHKSRSAKSFGSFKAESPKFKLNIGRDSARSIKLEDDFQRKDAEESSFRRTPSEDGSQPRTDRIPPIMVKSPSVESVISTRRSFKEEEVATNRCKNENTSQRSDRKSRRQSKNPQFQITEQRKTRSPAESQKPSPVEKSQKTSRKSSAISPNKEVAATPNLKSGRSSKSPKTKTPKTGTPRSNKIPELSLPIDTGERPRTAKTTDTTRKDSERSETRRRSHRPSDRSTSNPTGASPRRFQMTPRNNSGSHRRSKESFENQEELESGRTHSWTESEKICDTASNHSLISNSWRQAGMQSQQHSYRSDVHSPESENTSKQQLSRSRNSSRISVIPETEGKSPKQSYCTPKESPIEKTHKSSYHPEEDREDEEQENLVSSQRSKTGDESDRLSHKRLSVINEVSLEDLETSNVSTLEDVYRPSTRQDTNRTSSPERTSIDDSPSTDFLKPEKEQWDKLINEFNRSSKSFVLHKFPGFPLEKNIAWNAAENNDKNPEENSFSIQNTQKALSFEKSMPDTLNDLVYSSQSPLSDKRKQEEFVQSSRNVYYVNVSRGGSFGIGEFGDVTCWNAEKLKIAGDVDLFSKDLDKPKDHGDGITTRATEVRLREKEVKTQSGKTFRGSTPLSNTMAQEVADDEDFTHHIRLKASKSDNCINKKVTDCQTSTDSFVNGSQYKSEAGDLERNWSKGQFASKSTINQSSSSGSLGTAKDWENLEFTYDRTPRLSRSLSNLDVRIQENMHERTPSETLSRSAGGELYKTPCDTSNLQTESPPLHSFLARRAREDKMAAKSGNWLKLKHGNAKHLPNKKAKTRKSKEPFRDYLSSRKGRTARVPALKLRNANCFQNFYKRFISVFCLTSNSSAATSK